MRVKPGTGESGAPETPLEAPVVSPATGALPIFKLFLSPDNSTNPLVNRFFNSLTKAITHLPLFEMNASFNYLKLINNGVHRVFFFLGFSILILIASFKLSDIACFLNS